VDASSAPGTAAASSPPAPAPLFRVAGDRWLRERSADRVPGFADGELARLITQATRAGASRIEVIAVDAGAAGTTPLAVAVGLPAAKASRVRLIKLCTTTWNAHGTEGTCVDDGSDEFVFDFRPTEAAAPAPTP
jgi:hypothetical protein